jgi:hypothetical protein
MQHICWANLLEHGLAEVVHFNFYGMALSAKRINVHHFGMRAGPTAGFGGVRFSIGLGKEILSLDTWGVVAIKKCGDSCTRNDYGERVHE